MGVGALVGLGTMHGIEETEMREQYNALTQEQKQQYLEIMSPLHNHLILIISIFRL